MGSNLIKGSISLCDGNNIIAKADIPNNASGIITVILNVGSKKAKSLYVESLEGIVYKIE